MTDANSNGNALGRLVKVPTGGIEPHADLLILPPAGQQLYKVMTVENLLRSIADSYLHFNRVDSYKDFQGADSQDGQQLPRDLPINDLVRFEKSPEWSAAKYYDQSRARTYACCFSTVNSDHIWSEYGNGPSKGKVCMVFDFAKLRSTLNRTLQPGNTILELAGIQCRQMFSINYGLITYVDWKGHMANSAQLLNPILYTYMKAKAYQAENELRISLSTFGIGHFVLNDGTPLEFPSSLSFGFNFMAAIADGTVPQILCAMSCDEVFLREELDKLGIRVAG